MMIEEGNVAVADAETAKKGRKARDKHPEALGASNLIEVPGDFDFEIHARLVVKDFQEEYQFLMYRAADASFRSSKFALEAEESRALGSVASRKKAKKLVKLRDSMQELIDSLKEQGLDTDKILGVNQEQVA